MYIKFFPPKSVKKTQKNVSLIKVEVLLRMQASFLQKKNQKNIDFCHMIGCLSKIWQVNDKYEARRVNTAPAGL